MKSIAKKGRRMTSRKRLKASSRKKKIKKKSTQKNLDNRYPNFNQNRSTWPMINFATPKSRSRSIKLWRKNLKNLMTLDNLSHMLIHPSIICISIISVYFGNWKIGLKQLLMIHDNLWFLTHSAASMWNIDSAIRVSSSHTFQHFAFEGRQK